MANLEAGRNCIRPILEPYNLTKKRKIMEETTVTTLQKAAEVLAGKTGYKYVNYHGKRFSRSAACSSHFANMVHNGCGVDITVSAAKEYIKSVITARRYPSNVSSNCVERFPHSRREGAPDKPEISAGFPRSIWRAQRRGSR
jgi:hypothetical protein